MKRLLLVPIVIACACGAPPAATRTATTLLHLEPAADPRDAGASVPPPAVDICARVMREQRSKLTLAIADERKKNAAGWKEVTDDEMMKLLSPPNGVGVTCLAFPDGAWALEVVSFTFYPEWRSFAAQLAAVAYVGTTRAQSANTMGTGYGGMFTMATASLASDYDGDGAPELYVNVYEEGVEGGHAEEGSLYTSARGTVKAYPPAAPLMDLGAPKDVDGDGRLDLPTSAGIRIEGPVECQGKSDWDAAAFIAHALPDGRFSTNDAVAKKFARAWCPAPPTKVSSVTDAVCAHLWASTPQTMAAARKLATSCVRWDCALEFANKPQPKDASAGCESRQNAFEASVPFTLP